MRLKKWVVIDNGIASDEEACEIKQSWSSSNAMAGDSNMPGEPRSAVAPRDTLSLSLSETDDGSWVIFELPGFTTPAGGVARSSLEALRDASAILFLPRRIMLLFILPD
jgi:hypothetical protein